jgi:hypothetical protein
MRSHASAVEILELADWVEQRGHRKAAREARRLVAAAVAMLGRGDEGAACRGLREAAGVLA